MTWVFFSPFMKVCVKDCPLYKVTLNDVEARGGRDEPFVDNF